MHRFTLLLLLLPGAFAAGQSYESIRNSQHEWQCETQDGTKISGHTRHDKAEQSCVNTALQNPGEVYIVRGGTYRIVATNPFVGQDPDDIPDPVIDDSTDPGTSPGVDTVQPDPTPGPDPEGALVTFGPIDSIIQYPSNIAALAQDLFRWEITFTANNLISNVDDEDEPQVDTRMGLASRDENGQAESGHLSIWIEDAGIADHRIMVRNQDIKNAGQSIKLQSTTTIEPGIEYRVTVSVDEDNGLKLAINGEVEKSDPTAYGMANSTLPLTVGGLCSTCTADRGPTLPFDGTIVMRIYDDPLPAPQLTSFELMWTNPTERVDGAPLLPSEIMAINLYQTRPGGRNLIVTVDPDQSGYEVTGIEPGVEYCFVATAVANGESDDSNIACGIL